MTNKRDKNAEYQRTQMHQVKFSLNKNTDQDMIAFLETIPNKAALLKELIRQEMERTDFTFCPEKAMEE